MCAFSFAVDIKDLTLKGNLTRTCGPRTRARSRTCKLVLEESEITALRSHSVKSINALVLSLQNN